MAASPIAKWTVVVVEEANESLTGVYRMSPRTKLSELLEIWKDEFDVFGHWVFMSANKEITYHDNSITLENVGETASRTVTLTAVIMNEPSNKIYVYTKDKFHQLSVKPNDKLCELMWRLPEKPNRLEYNGSSVNVMHTIQQNGLQNKSVIHEPSCPVAVKLSSGYTEVFQIPSNGVVLHLKDRVNVYEANDFSLTYEGKCLNSDESVRQLTQVVEVETVKFTVNFKDKPVSWITKREPIAVSEFLCQLAANANIDTKELKTLQFVCIGCKRRISQSEGFVQRLPVECCENRSLTLNVVSPSDSGTASEPNDATQQIQILHKHLVEHRSKNSTSVTSRCVYREIYDNFGETGLDYNILTRCSDSLFRTITELEDKIKELNVVLETLKTKNLKSETEIEKLRTVNMKRKEEIEALKKEAKKLISENDKLVDEKKKLADANKELIDAKKKVVRANRELVEEKERMKKEQNSVSREMIPRGATGGGPSHPPTMRDEQRGVKLLVVYLPSHFSSASCPEVTSQGQWSFDSVSIASIPSIARRPPLFTFLSYAKCEVRGIRPGRTSFKEVVAVLQPLFRRGKISGIGQWLGSVAGRTVTRATSRDGDEALRDTESPFCGVDGKEHSWLVAGKPREQIIVEGGNVFACGGERRTVMKILPR